ncbi:MAG: respiratory nitrate reductase subunit gamma [Elusimicrobia bacterium]|nr:respiratory nitrate reductase subunit gamma [Elusimicrobiota bacterium]
MSEGLYMFQEIVFLKGVWEHNRSLWIFSFPFHFGLYLLTAMTACLAGAALVPDVFRPAAWIFGAAGYILGAFGALGLLIKRAFDPKLKTFASLSSYFNLVFLAALFLSGAAALFSGPFLCQMTSFIRAFFTVNPGITLDAPITAHIIIAMLFLVYLPFTYMMHFVAKYFTYHEVRWNDEPMAGNAAMEKEVKQLLSQKVTWAAKHIGADGKKNWVDIATMSLPEEKKNA